MARMSEVEVNGVRFETSWDLEHPVFNVDGKPVMGVTEYDKASPDCVMVSVNGPALADTETLLRSTIAHEIGHVVFDAPGWILVPHRLQPGPGLATLGLSKLPQQPREKIVRAARERAGNQRVIFVGRSARWDLATGGVGSHELGILPPQTTAEFQFRGEDSYGEIK